MSEENAKQAELDEAKEAIEGATPAVAEESMTQDDVKNVVISSLKAVGLDEETVKSLKAKLDESGSEEGLKLEDVQKAVKECIGGESIDQDALLEQVKKHVAETKGVSKEELSEQLKAFAKEFKAPSRHEYEVGNAGFEAPIQHRAGNLTVAQKQLLNICMGNAQDEGITEAQMKRAVNNGIVATKSARQKALYGQKALTTDGVGSGAELINTDLSSDLQSRLYLESALAAAMVAQEIQMPSNPFQLPMTTTRPAFYVGSEGGTPTNSDPGTSQPTLDAKKLIGQSTYSYEADEDAIVAILPMLQETLGSGASDALEGALINGDTTGTHQDSDIDGVTNHHAKLFKGIRKYASAGSLTKDLSTGGISASNIASMRKQMGKYGVRPRDLILLAGVNGYNDLITLDETLTADKVGSDSARILTGNAPTLFGIPIVVSSQVREDLNASGVYDGVTTDKGSIYLIHRPSWLVGVRRGFTVEVDTDKRTQLNYVIASFRRAFIPMETPSASVPVVSMGYNYTA